MFPQATSHGNILTFTPRGFKQSLNVKFPDSRLAVCVKCKKNYKTRDMCRVRNGHTTEPWTTAYICLTLDESCTDENGGFIDKPLTVRMVQWQPFSIKKAFDPKTPVCAACKRTNRTRSFCRERHKHRQLPWCTVYVLLSALDGADPATIVAAPSKPVVKTEDVGENQKEVEINHPHEEVEPVVLPADDSADKDGGADETKVSDNLEESDDINDIAESRTFLAKVSCRENTVHWLEIAEYNDFSEANAHNIVANADAQSMGAGVAHAGMDPAHAQYYAHSMGYNAQQHQNALKSHQQYFFQLQQRQQQHFAAHQAAWQAQYSQQGHLQQPAPNGQGNPTEAASQPGTQPYGVMTAGEAAQNGAPPSGSPSFKQDDALPTAQPWMMYHQYQHPMPMHPQAMQQTGLAPGAEMPTGAPQPAEHYRPTNGASDANNSDGEADDVDGGDVKRQRI
jgi:hypothetical protein